MRVLGPSLAVGVLVVWAWAGAGTAEAKPGAVFVPPLEVELGHSVTGTAGGGTIEATQLMIGVSWASLWPRDTPVDVSLGVICNMYPAVEPTLQARVVEAVEPEGDTDAGTYIDVAVRTARGRHWRTWVGARGELIDQGDVSALGVAARASMELWTPAVGGDSSGHTMAAVFGTLAVSAWAEMGVREHPRGAVSFTAAGLGVRIPFMIAAGG